MISVGYRGVLNHTPSLSDLKVMREENIRTFKKTFPEFSSGRLKRIILGDSCIRKLESRGICSDRWNMVPWFHLFIGNVADLDIAASYLCILLQATCFKLSLRSCISICRMNTFLLVCNLDNSTLCMYITIETHLKDERSC